MTVITFVINAQDTRWSLFKKSAIRPTGRSRRATPRCFGETLCI